jgi:5-methylcytosine-specific restriction protein B
LLLIGPPGTGKTVLLEHLIDFVENPGRGVQFDADKAHDAWEEVEGTEPGKTASLVLHPSYQYDNLVVGLLPRPAEGGGVGVRVATGPLVNLAHYASQDGRRALLVLDEFNRANAAAVLGDTLALLDKDKRGRAHIDLAYGDLGIQVPDGYAANGTTGADAHFTLPPGLWVVAAMNTSDRSVAPLDAALRRRFTIVEKQPDYDLLAEHLGADAGLDLTEPLEQWTVEHVSTLAVELLRALNARIDAVLGIDFRLGHSNVWGVEGSTVEEALLALCSAFDHRIVQTLRLSLQDDDGALAAILRAGTSEQPLSGEVGVAWWVKPDAELGTYASARLHVQEVSALSTDAVFSELKRQAEV